MKFYENRVLRNIPVAVVTLLLLAGNPLHIPADTSASAYESVAINEVQREPIDDFEWNRSTLRDYAKSALPDFGWNTKEQWICLGRLWGKESAWNHEAVYERTNDYGVPQRHFTDPNDPQIEKFMADPIGQIRWGLGYIEKRYGSPCGAWRFWQSNRWY